jgi:hypothetical protein
VSNAFTEILRSSFITGAVQAIADPSKPRHISKYILKCVDAMPAILMNKLLDVITSGAAAEVDAAAHNIDHKDQQTCNPFEDPFALPHTCSPDPSSWAKMFNRCNQIHWTQQSLSAGINRTHHLLGIPV